MIPVDTPTFDLKGAHDRAKKTIWLPILLTVVWLMFSCMAFFYFASPTWFQRCSAIGVAGTLIGFSLLKAKRQEYTTNVLESLVFLIRKSISFVRAEAQLKQAPMIAPSGMPSANSEELKPLEIIDQAILGLDQSVAAAVGQMGWWQGKDSKFLVMEIVVTFMVTIQGGIGDMLVNYAMLCGRLACQP